MLKQLAEDGDLDASSWDYEECRRATVVDKTFVDSRKFCDFNHSIAIDLDHLRCCTFDSVHSTCASLFMTLNELFVKTAYDSQNTSKSKNKLKKYEAKMRDENELGENQKIYSVGYQIPLVLDF